MSPVALESRSSCLLGHCALQLRKSCAGANMVYSRAENVSILEHYFASKSSAAVRKAFSNAYPDKEVLTKTAHRMVTTWNGIRIFGRSSLLCYKKWKGLLVSVWRGDGPHCEHNCIFTARVFDKCIVGRGLWPPRSPDLTPPDFNLWLFLRERVHSNDPRSLKELKHNIEQTVANIGPEALRKVTRNTLKKGWMLVFKKLVDIFSICCKAVL
jgi:hypothetical protein